KVKPLVAGGFLLRAAFFFLDLQPTGCSKSSLQDCEVPDVVGEKQHQPGIERGTFREAQALVCLQKGFVEIIRSCSQTIATQIDHAVLLPSSRSIAASTCRGSGSLKTAQMR